MTTLSYTVPVAGSTLNSIADPEISTALNTITTWANGNVDGTNLSAAAAQSAAVNQAGQTVKGATNISASQSTSSTTFTTLATPDQVTGIVLPTNGLIAVWYWATWQESVSAAANADIFIGSNQLKAQQRPGNTSPTNNPATIGNTVVNTNYALSSYFGGLASAQQQTGTNVGAGPYGGDVTTGQAVGFGFNAGLTEFWAGGPCYVFAAAGTYTVSVQFKASSGSVTVANRKLWVQAISFA